VPPSPRPRVRHAAEPRARPAEARVAELARETGGGPRAGASPRGQGLRDGEVEPSAEELPKIFSHIHGHPQLASFHPSPEEHPEPNPPHRLPPMPSNSKTVVRIPPQRSSSELRPPPMAAKLELTRQAAAETKLQLAPLAALAWHRAQPRLAGGADPRRSSSLPGFAASSLGRPRLPR
jgi:hypothetical protein